MNGKKAKALRREAQRMTAGEPAVQYKSVDSVKTTHFTPKPIVHHRCTRTIYKALKKNPSRNAWVK